MENNKPSGNNNNNNSNFPEKQTWGTREELLLACAVHRYGTENWSSVAVEVQKRSSALHLLITPHSCQQKFHDLKRRFSPNDAVSLTTDSKDYKDDAVSWLDELKKLRVAELKRELERYDLSIVSLQLKVKRLTEEREQSLIKNEENEPEKSDQDRTVERTGEEERIIIENDEPDSLTGKPDSGDDSERENRSVNESNWTDPKAEGEEDEKEPELVEPVRDEPELVVEDVKPAGEDSYNGSCGRVDSRNSERVDSAESKDDDNKGRESSSDVQSAVSLSRKEEEEDGEEEKSEEPDNDENQSPTATVPKRRVSVECQPLIECLEIIRSHKFGPLFERFDVKETPGCRTLIRQHIDLETIRTRLEESWYSGCSSSFFRDLLLLFNNAIVFFNKNSLESTAAIELRGIVLKEIVGQTSDPNLPLKEKSLTSPTAQIVKLELESSDSLPSKRNILIPLIACRKRSSITAKRAVSASSGAEKKKEETPASVDKNSVPDLMEHDKFSVKTDQETRVTKKRTRERSTSSIRSLSKKGKIRKKHRGNKKTKKSSDVNANASGHSSEEEESNTENSETEADKEMKSKSKANVNAKKRSAANFLSRMKRSSPSKNDTLLETLKSSVINSENGRERAEQKNKNSNNVKVDRKKEQIKQTRPGGKRGKERESPVKTNEGRPTRRAAVAPSPAVMVPVTRGRRRRDSVETEASSLAGTRKRSKK